MVFNECFPYLTGHLKANDVQTDSLTAPYFVLYTCLFLGFI